MKKRWMLVLAALAATGVAVQLAAAPASAPATASRLSSGSATATSSAPASGPFRLATYNINFGMTDDKSLSSIVAIIRKANADLVAIQETTDSSAGYFRRTLASAYPHMIFVDGPRAGGLAILSRQPVEKHVLAASSGGPFGTLLVRTKLAGRDAWVASLHLCPTVPAGNEGIREYLQLFAKTDAVRAKEIAYISQELAKLNKSGEPVVMMGDFNSPSQFAAPSALAAQGYIDSYAALNKLPDSQPTWQWDWKGTRYGFRLDYIFHARQLRTLESSVLAGGPSDHYLVVSLVQWADLVTATQAGTTTGSAASEPASRANTPSGLPIPPPPGSAPQKIPTPPTKPAKTVEESRATPEAMAAGLRAGLIKPQFLEKKITWKLTVQESAKGADGAILKANSSTGFLVTCRVPEALAAQMARLKADDAIEVEGTILNLAYDRPQETSDVFGAKIEMLGVLLNLSKLQKVEKPK